MSKEKTVLTGLSGFSCVELMAAVEIPSPETVEFTVKIITQLLIAAATVYKLIRERRRGKDDENTP